MAADKIQRFTIALRFSALIDIAPTMAILADIEEFIPADVIGPGLVRFLREKLEMRLDTAQDDEAKLSAGLSYTVEELEEFIYQKLDEIQQMY